MSLVTVKEELGSAAFVVHFLYITKKTERFSFKSGHVLCIAKTDWLAVLQ